MAKLLILDRDGVINEDSPNYIRSVDDWQPIPGSIEAIAELSQQGWTVAVATNQSGLARGYFDLEALQTMHDELRRRVSALGGSVDAIAYCPHGPQDHCQCRKPLPGMLLQLCERFDAAPQNTPFIGDSERDIQAAISANCQPFLVRTGNGNSVNLCKGKYTEVNEVENLLSFSRKYGQMVSQASVNG